MVRFQSEGADFEVTIEHLQPWEVPEHRALQHAHAFHMRYYHSALAAQKLDRVTLRTRAGSRDFYRVAASAHYEVGHANPNHADVEICPICGRTGEYASQPGNLVERVHDPLGLELLLNGTIRGTPVHYHHEDQRELGGIIRALGDRFAVQHQVFPAQSGDRNTLRIGVVVIGARDIDLEFAAGVALPVGESRRLGESLHRRGFNAACRDVTTSNPFMTLDLR